MLNEIIVNEVINGIKAMTDGEVTVVKVQKNNGVTLHGLNIKFENENIVPTLYLEHYITKETNLKAMNEICRDLYGTYMEARKQNEYKGDDVINMVKDFKNVMPKLMPRLVNKKANANVLDNLIWKGFQDLAIIVTIDLGTSDKGKASIKVTKQLAEQWNVKESTIIDVAMSNLTTDNARISSMFDMLMGMVPSEMIDFVPSKNDMPMYVITNNDGVNGATYMVKEELLKELADKFNVDEVVVLPSSIHEVIVIPKRDDVDVESMTAMVQEVNATQLAMEEVLSDHAYVYNKEMGWR